jgi:hypothetical protein
MLAADGPTTHKKRINQGAFPKTCQVRAFGPAGKPRKKYTEDTMKELGKFTAEDPRNCWPHEEKDFTPWLKEHIDELAGALNLDSIEVMDTEFRVGKYFADIAGKVNYGEETITIVIENQLEKSDHDHLGKLITYASGLDAKLIVWICKEVEDEHRAAVDWLNEKTNGDISFFLVNLELLKIDNSRPAVRFEIVCEPNNWKDIIKEMSSQHNDTRLKQLKFWTKYQNFLEKQEELKKVYNYKIRKALPENWYTLIIKPGKAFVECIVSFPQNYIRCDLRIETKKLYEALFRKKEAINRDLQLDLEWDESLLEKEQHNNGVKYYNQNISLDEENFTACFQWLFEISMKYVTVLPKYLE